MSGPPTTPDEDREAHFWFGSDARPLAGVLHAPDAARARDLGVVLCKPFGVDLLGTHRAYRQLALGLADAGFPTLRFDYDGTGDSAGSDDDPGRVDAWLASIGLAIDELRDRAGVDRVCLFGAGFGGLLAAAHASKTPVDALALFGPPASGHAWLREARAFQLLKGKRGAASKDDDEELVGFTMARETAEALRALDPGPAATRHVLIVPRDDLPGAEDKLKERFRTGGAAVDVTPAPGYGAMFRDDPYASVVPDAAWSTINAWLVERSAPRAHGAPRLSPRASSLVESRAGAPLVRESFTRAGPLFAVVSEPVDEGGHRATVLLANIGANAHYGANRMYVAMARAWAREGFRAVRLDLPGLGDAPATPGEPDNRIYAPGVVGDVRRAIDALERPGERFVLLGLCSGAYTAYHVAIADPRVAGIVLVNPLTFQWREGDSLEVRARRTIKSRRYYARALFDRESWARLARGEVHLKVVSAELARRAVARAAAAFRDARRGAGAIERGFRALDARGVATLLVFGSEDGGVDVIESHLGRGARRMRGAKHFTMEILDGPDHTFTSVRWQRHLLTLLTRHLALRFSLPRERTDASTSRP